MALIARLLVLYFATLAPLSTIAAPDSKQEVSYARVARAREIIGAWVVLSPQRGDNRSRYVAISADGRIAWLLAPSESTTETSTSIVAAIEKGDALRGSTTGWKHCAVRDGELVVAATSGEAEEFFSAKILTTASDAAAVPVYMPGNIGDLILQKFHLRLPSNVDASGPPPHVLLPAPIRLRRVAE
jgi:hypothetical protein